MSNTIVKFEVMWAEAVQSDDKDAFVLKWSTSPIWGEEKGRDFLLSMKIGLYMGDLWDAAHMSVSDMHRQSGMTQAEMARALCVPLRTLEDWCRGKATPPAYVRMNMLRQLKLMPSMRDINYSLSPETVDAKLSAQKGVFPTIVERGANMSKLFTVEEVPFFHTEVCVADWIAAGNEIDVDALEEAGHDPMTMAPVEIIGRMEDNYLHIYYRIQDYGTYTLLYGIDPQQLDMTPKQAFEHSVFAVLAQGAWEDFF